MVVYSVIKKICMYLFVVKVVLFLKTRLFNSDKNISNVYIWESIPIN